MAGAYNEALRQGGVGSAANEFSPGPPGPKTWDEREKPCGAECHGLLLEHDMCRVASAGID